MVEEKIQLNQRERDILEAIKKNINDRGYPPTVREIGKAVGLRSSSTVHGYLHRLEEKELIKLDATKPRALVILAENEVSNPYKETVNVPLVGQVAAGLPLLAEENLEDVFPLPADFTGRGNVFMLRVKGDSMIEAGILDGDLVLVRSQPTVNNGEIAVAMIENEATCKKFYKEKDHVRLEPANSSFAPIIVEEVTILGKVIGLMRKI